MNDPVKWQLLVSRVMPDLRGLPRPFWVLCAGTLINRIGGFVLIFLAIYLTDERGFTAAQAGAAISAYGLGAIVGGPIGGTLSDRIGRRHTLVASLMAGGAAMIVLGVVTGPATIMIVATITGALYEMYRPVVAATVADLVAAEDRTRAYSLMHWMVNIGASIAAGCGGLLAAHSYRTLFVVDAATTAAYGLMEYSMRGDDRTVAALDRQPWGVH